MSGLDSLPLDAEGYLDLDQLPADVLDDDAVAQLHEALLADPVDEPSDDDWSALVTDVVDGEVDLAPFDADGDLGTLAYDAEVDTEADGGTDVDGPADEADPDPDPDVDLDTDLDVGLEVDADLDVIGLDLADDEGLVDAGGAYDDDLAVDVDAEAPADISHDFEDYL